MNIASVDIGSNTVLLLIAKVDNGNIKTVVNKFEMPRISAGLLPGKPIAKDKVDLLLDILESYKKKISEYNCRDVIITATNAMRIASNTKEIIDRVKRELDLDISIIDGNEEAKLSFLGASLTIPEVKKKTVIDIGGGSTEVIYGSTENIIFRYSFPVGVVNLTEKFLTSFPYKENDFSSIENHLSEIFDNFVEENIPKGITAVAVAGTPTSLSAIHQNLKEYDENKIEGAVLFLHDIIPILNRMKKLQSKEIKNVYGKIIEGREDVILAGTLILVYLMKILSIDRIYVSEKGVRYGNIIKYISNLKANYGSG